jgi:hypothetical protein
MQPIIHHHCPANTEETAQMNSAVAASMFKKLPCCRQQPVRPPAREGCTPAPNLLDVLPPPQFCWIFIQLCLLVTQAHSDSIIQLDSRWFVVAAVDCLSPQRGFICFLGFIF